MTFAAVMRWTEGSEVADPVGTAFAVVGLLAVWAVILEAAMGHLEQRNADTVCKTTLVFIKGLIFCQYETDMIQVHWKIGHFSWIINHL